MVKSSDKAPGKRSHPGPVGKRPARRKPAPRGEPANAELAPGLPTLTGHFLIAMPGMGDPNFARGITFICQHSEDGAMGLVVNRLSDFRLGDVLRQMHMPCERKEVATAPDEPGRPRGVGFTRCPLPRPARRRRSRRLQEDGGGR